ncbi:hypothetical protein [Rhodococcus sp. PSBB049]|uniref:hypothetical protein n=1 Tax=Rhodococcus sp. PSBB049 TaxID=2812863 RepID=UPI00197DA0D9|nr:hypothetical protein [Rhodococcus sp. PSBB049]QSE72505.1 hypothetical protein JYA91_29795 [Rhodococcus sp. PSBB049]
MADSTDVPEVTTKDGMIDWLVESFTGQSVGLIIDLGPRDYVHVDDDHDSVNETVASGLWQRRMVPAFKRRTPQAKSVTTSADVVTAKEHAELYSRGDRMLPHTTVVITDGESYRMRPARRRGDQP